MKYYFFLDESGDHGLSKVDKSFPVFVLCGVLFSHTDYLELGKSVLSLKNDIWGNKKVILHSSDIRKCDKEFTVLFNPAIKAKFYSEMDAILSGGKYCIISAGVDKNLYNQKYGKIGHDVYQVSLSYIIERLVFYMDDISGEKEVSIFIEKRGGKEDSLLSQHLQKILARGTYFVNSERLNSLITSFKFIDKKDDIIGLQISDLIAYPIARHLIDKERANPAFDVISSRFYCKGGKLFGLKQFP